ncbi:hypothetical protein BC830DRAFT_1216072 [Chytriomyces sp. MP71]|nr:hypothetical protein BC830DRAFT_1216072 [Chytriomyces sp. MP71]
MPFDRTQLMKPPHLISGTLAGLGWFLQFVGDCILSAPGFSGFALFYLLVVNLGVFTLVAFGQTAEHRVAIVAFVAIGFNFLVGLADSAIAGSKNASLFSQAGLSGNANAFNCIAAGCVLQSFVYIYWILRFGSGESSPITVLGNTAPGFNMPNIPIPVISFKQRGVDNVPAQAAQNHQADGMGASPTFASTNLSADPIVQYAAPASLATPVPPPVPQANPSPVVMIKARALYAYTANDADPKEISFAKGEILDITDNKGKWWILGVPTKRKERHSLVMSAAQLPRGIVWPLIMWVLGNVCVLQECVACVAALSREHGIECAVLDIYISHVDFSDPGAWREAVVLAVRTHCTGYAAIYDVSMGTAQEEIDAELEGIGGDVRQRAAAILNLGFNPPIGGRARQPNNRGRGRGQQPVGQVRAAPAHPYNIHPARQVGSNALRRALPTPNEPG